MKIPKRHILRNYDYSKPNYQKQTQKKSIHYVIPHEEQNTIEIQSSEQSNNIVFNPLSDDQIKISQLPEATEIADSDLIPVVDYSETITKKIQFSNFKSDFSLVGHTHTSSNITDFNSAVSGLIPDFVVSNSGDNRILTSTGSSLGINAENNLLFDGTTLYIPSGYINIARPFGGGPALSVSGVGSFGEGSDIVTIGNDMIGGELGLSTQEEYIAVKKPNDSSLRYGGVDNNPAIVISSGFNVGIKIDNPNYTLDINGSGYFASGLFIKQEYGLVSVLSKPLYLEEFGSSSTFKIVNENRAFGPTISIQYHGDTGELSDPPGAIHRATPRLNFFKSQGAQIAPSALKGWEAMSTIRTEAVDITGSIGTVSRIITWADGVVGGSNIYQPTQIDFEVSSGSGKLDKNMKIFSTGAITTNCSLSVDEGLSAPTPIFNLGSISGNTAISYDLDKQIQKSLLIGSTNFTQGSGWDLVDKSVDVFMEIKTNTTNIVSFDSSFVTEWYNPIPSFTSGTYLVLLRSMQSGVVQGHYIGKKG